MTNKILLTFALATLLSLTSCSKAAGNITAPTFEKTAGVRFAAYSGPTVANWSGGSGNPNTFTDRNMRKLAEAGFNKIIALYEGAGNAHGSDTWELIKNRAIKAQRDALQALPLAEKYNIKYYVRDWSFYGLVKNYTSGYSPNVLTDEDYKRAIDIIFDEDNEYIYSPAYGGSFCHDEPFYEELDRIAVQVRLYQEKMEELGLKGVEPIVNLFPDIVDSASLSKQGKTYHDYVEHYFETIAPLLGYVCYDYYPFMSDVDDGSYLRNSYLNNLNLMAKLCKENNIELRTFLQSVGNWTGMRDMTTIGDFRFQIYTEMAFGSREFVYYEYSNNHTVAEGGYALFDYQHYDENDLDEEGNPQAGVYNFTFDLASKVNNEVHKMEDAYLNYKWDGVMYKNANEFIDNINFTFLENDAIQHHPRLKIKENTEDVLVGTFKNKDDDNAFMVVNFVDPYFKKNNEVKLHFENARGLLMYRLGERVVVTLPSSGDYTLKLYPGEGRFIIPIK